MGRGKPRAAPGGRWRNLLPRWGIGGRRRGVPRLRSCRQDGRRWAGSGPNDRLGTAVRKSAIGGIGRRIYAAGDRAGLRRNRAVRQGRCGRRRRRRVRASEARGRAACAGRFPGSAGGRLICVAAQPVPAVAQSDAAGWAGSRIGASSAPTAARRDRLGASLTRLSAFQAVRQKVSTLRFGDPAGISTLRRAWAISHWAIDVAEDRPVASRTGAGTQPSVPSVALACFLRVKKRKLANRPDLTPGPCAAGPVLRPR